MQVLSLAVHTVPCVSHLWDLPHPRSLACIHTYDSLDSFVFTGVINNFQDFFKLFSNREWNSSTFQGLEGPNLNSKPFPGFQTPWEPCISSLKLIPEMFLNKICTFQFELVLRKREYWLKFAHKMHATGMLALLIANKKFLFFHMLGTWTCDWFWEIHRFKSLHLDLYIKAMSICQRDGPRTQNPTTVFKCSPFHVTCFIGNS